MKKMTVTHPNLFSSELVTLERLLLAQAEINATVSLDVPWKDRYDLVFSDRRCGAACESFEKLVLDFNWTAPTKNYEADVIAFAHDLDARIKELAPFFALISTHKSLVTQRIKHLRLSNPLETVPDKSIE